MPPILPRDRLLALVNASKPTADDERPRRIPYPTPEQVLYDPPNPDGTRKRCGSCYKFVSSGACTEVAGVIAPGQVCGLFVWGTPQGIEPVIAVARKVTQKAAGLIDTPDGLGTACEICRFVTPQADDLGLCNAVGSADGLPPVVVDRLGCCCRWETNGG